MVHVINVLLIGQTLFILVSIPNNAGKFITDFFMFIENVEIQIFKLNNKYLIQITYNV